MSQYTPENSRVHKLRPVHQHDSFFAIGAVETAHAIAQPEVLLRATCTPGTQTRACCFRESRLRRRLMSSLLKTYTAAGAARSFFIARETDITVASKSCFRRK